MKSTNSIYRVAAAIAVAAFVATICGCTRGDKRNTDLQYISSTASYHLLGTAQDMGRDSDLVFTDSLSLMLPTTVMGRTAAVLRDSILALTLDTIVPHPEQILDARHKVSAENVGYDVARLPVVHDLRDSDGFNIVSGTVVNLNSDFLIYEITYQTYYPMAAHGMYGQFYLNYYIPENKILSLNDLFTADGLAELPKIIAEKAAEMPDNEDVDITDLPSDGNFYITHSDDIAFVYQPYEVAPYVRGIVEVRLYPYELHQYLTPQGIALFNLSDIID